VQHGHFGSGFAKPESVEGDVALLNLLKKLFFWNYARNTWQWDALCVVILIFIFLTPKAWWERGERLSAATHQTRNAQTVLISPEVIDNMQDKAQVEQRVRELTGRRDVHVLDVRKVVGPDGKTRAVEVDIR
jgi:hypothetical protein